MCASPAHTRLSPPRGRATHRCGAALSILKLPPRRPLLSSGRKKKKKHPAQRPTLGQKTPFSHPAVETTYTPTQHACQGHPCTGVCWRESKRERSFILLKRGTRAGGVRRDAEMPRYVQNTATLACGGITFVFVFLPLSLSESLSFFWLRCVHNYLHPAACVVRGERLSSEGMQNETDPLRTRAEGTPATTHLS